VGTTFSLVRTRTLRPVDCTPEVCDDTIDNDCDGYFDGDDSDCP
jgi:hypothetical protein